MKLTLLFSTRALATIQILPSHPHPMSTSFQSANLSTDNFTAIFDAASSEYQSVTGTCLDSHPFNTQLSSGDTPMAISEILRIKAQAFDERFGGDEDLMTWLDPTIQILLTLSATLGGKNILVGSVIHSFSHLSDHMVP